MGLTIRRKINGHGQKPFSQHKRSLRASLTAGTVCILLTGTHRGKRCVFLKQLDSGLALVTGPYKVDVSAVQIPERVNDTYFKRAKAAKASEEGIFESTQAKYTASAERKEDQKAVDAGILSAIKATPYLAGYLKAQFGLSKGQFPHKPQW